MPAVQHRTWTPKFPASAASQTGVVAPQADASTWLSSRDLRSVLNKLQGKWLDQKGSSYTLHIDEFSVVASITRLSGATIEANNFVQVLWNRDRGRIVSGPSGTSSMYTIAELSDEAVMWQTRDGKSKSRWERPPVNRSEAEVKLKKSPENRQDRQAWTAKAVAAWQPSLPGRPIVASSAVHTKSVHQRDAEILEAEEVPATQPARDPPSSPKDPARPTAWADISDDEAGWLDSWKAQSRPESARPVAPQAPREVENVDKFAAFRNMESAGFCGSRGVAGRRRPGRGPRH